MGRSGRVGSWEELLLYVYKRLLGIFFSFLEREMEMVELGRIPGVAVG